MMGGGKGRGEREREGREGKKYSHAARMMGGKGRREREERRGDRRG
jgi:hypothetical protein